MLATSPRYAELIRVLVVEHDDYLRYLFFKALNVAGFSALQAANAEQAVSCIYTLQPHIVLMNPELPDGNGLDIIRQTRNHSAKSATFVVVCGNERVRQQADTGVEFFLYTPISISALVQLMQRVAANLHTSV